MKSGNDNKIYNRPDNTSIESLKLSFKHHLKYTLVDDEYSATKHDHFMSLALAVRDRLVEQWLQTQQSYYKINVKRVYYLSMEFLIGRLLTNNLINLGFYNEYRQALDELGHSLEELEEIEIEAGLGNGGLGRPSSHPISISTSRTRIWTTASLRLVTRSTSRSGTRAAHRSGTPFSGTAVLAVTRGA